MNQQTFQQTGNQAGGKAGQKFKPTGFVQSFYRQNQPSQQAYGSTQQQYGAQQNQNFQNFQTQSGYQPQGVQSFHSAGYKGNQPNHDQSWRSDSVNPSQQQAFGKNYGK